MRYLVDTSIWIDLYEDRKGYNNEPLGQYALRLLFNILSEKHVLIISDILLIELEKNYSSEEIIGMLAPFQEIVENIISNKKQRSEAEHIASDRNIPPGDALHAIISRDTGAIVITRDRHFKYLEDISKHYKPEDIISTF